MMNPRKKVMQKFWMNTALVALLLISGSALAQTGKTQPKEWQQQWEAIERQSGTVEQWLNGSAAILTKTEKVLDGILDTMNQDILNVHDDKLTQSELNTRWQQSLAPALSAEIKNLDRVMPQTDASLEPYMERLQKLLNITDCKTTTGDIGCADIRLRINAIGFTRSRLQNAVNLRRQALELLLEFTALNPENPDDFERYEEIQPEIDDLLEQGEKFKWTELPKEYSPYNPITANMVVIAYFRQDDYAEGLKWALSAAATQEQEKGEQHGDTGIAYINVGLAYAEQGEHVSALEWLQKALPIFSKQPLVYNQIAAVYERQANYEKALEWYQNALAIAVDAREISEMATSYSGIAKVYDQQGDYAKALEWNLKAVDIYEKEAGIKYPLTATSYHNLASVYEHQGDHAKALPLYLKAYRIRAKELGSAHPDTKASRASLKSTYLQTENPKPFIEWLQEN
jgi:tetratricopeptide (TPR) repeat protein